MVKHTKDDRPISSRVKRRLFDDEDDVSVTEGTKINVGLSADNMKLLNLCDAAEKSCHPSNAPSSTITIETDVLAEGTLVSSFMLLCGFQMNKKIDIRFEINIGSKCASRN